MHRAVTATVCAAALAALAAMPSWAAADSGSLADDTTADFLAGTAGGATQVTDAGSVELAPVREEFDGSALPDGLSSTPWSAGGGATVSGGMLTVDGTAVADDAWVSAGRSLELRATFGDVPFEHAGFGTDFADGPWAMFSTGNASLGLGLYARTTSAGAGSSVDVPIAGVDPSVPHTYRIDWHADEVDYFVDGIRVDAEPATISGQMRPIVSDLEPDGTGLSVDWLTPDLGFHQTTGAFLSRVLDAGDSRAAWGVLTAFGSPGIAVSTRAGNTATPDASWSDFADLGTGGEIRSPRGRYLQYRVTLATSDPTTTPSLDRVQVGYDVDTTAPTVALGSVHVTGAKATVSFSSDESGAHYQCQVDNGPLGVCASPQDFPGLTDGSHTITVTATDGAGNTGTATTDEFLVDTIAPTTSIDALHLTGKTASVDFSSRATDVARFECKLDTGAYSTCTTGETFDNLDQGPHTIAVRAIDHAGNVGDAATRDLTVDTIAPAVTIPEVTVTGTAVTVRFSSPDGDVARFECSLDGGAYAACKPFSGLTPGKHTVAVRAVDTAGNSGAARTQDFTVPAPVTTGGAGAGGGGGTPAPAAPAPADRTAPVIRLTPAKARAARNGVVKLAAACPPGESSCVVNVRLLRGRTVLARKTLTIAGGRSSAVSLKLSRAARRQLAHLRRMTVSASVTARDAAGNTGKRTTSLVVLATR